MERQRTDGSSFTMWKALVGSIVFHVLLLLLLMWIPWSSPASRTEPEELQVKFDLTPEPAAVEPVPEASESDLFKPSSDVEPDSDVPTNPAPSTLGAVAELSSQPSVESPPVPPLPQTEPQDRPPEPETVEDIVEPEPESESQPEPANDELPDASEETAEASGLDLPDDRPDLRPEQEQTAPPKRLDVNKAIRDLLSKPSAPRRQQDETPKPDNQGSPKGLELPDLDSLPFAGFGLDRNLYFESTDFDWSDYSRQIYMAIWRAWHYRLWATTDRFERWAFGAGNWELEHQVLIRFTIERNGQITGIAVVTPSGCIPLDESATNAMEEVVIQPLPDEFPRDRENVHARFIATGPIRAMKDTLNYLRRGGWF